MNRQFAAFRGLAMSIVVLYHSIQLEATAGIAVGIFTTNGWQSPFLLALLQLSVFAVPTFLFVSGAFLAYAAQGSSPRLTLKTVGTGLQHLLWPYLVWSVLFYLAIFLGEGTAFSPGDYVKNLLVGYPFNFVPLIAFYYVLSPVLVRLSKRFGWAVIAAIAVYQILLMNLVRPGTLGFSFPSWMWWLAPKVISSTMAVWGIFFPLGVIFCLKAREVTPLLVRFKWVLWALTIFFYLLRLLGSQSPSILGLTDFFAPLSFLLVIPSIPRDSVPFVRQFEKIGKRSYGIYLTHLLVLYLILAPIKELSPWLLGYQYLILPCLFALALGVPYASMNHIERTPMRRAYRYVFG